MFLFSMINAKMYSKDICTLWNFACWCLNFTNGFAWCPWNWLISTVQRVAGGMAQWWTRTKLVRVSKEMKIQYEVYSWNPMNRWVFACFCHPIPMKRSNLIIQSWGGTFQGTDTYPILGKRKIIFNSALWWDMLVPRRVNRAKDLIVLKVHGVQNGGTVTFCLFFLRKVKIQGFNLGCNFWGSRGTLKELPSLKLTEPMKITIFLGKYHQNCGFSMAMLVYRRVLIMKTLMLSLKALYPSVKASFYVDDFLLFPFGGICIYHILSYIRGFRRVKSWGYVSVFQKRTIPKIMGLRTST